MASASSSSRYWSFPSDMDAPGSQSREYGIDAFRNARRRRVEPRSGLERRRVGVRNPREILELAAAGALVKAPRIPLLAHGEWGIHEALQERVLVHQPSRQIALVAERRYGGGDDDEPGVQQELHG